MPSRVCIVQTFQSDQRDHGTDFSKSFANRGKRVTDADLAISQAIFDALRAQFPADDFFSEELAVGDLALREPGGDWRPLAAPAAVEHVGVEVVEGTVVEGTTIVEVDGTYSDVDGLTIVLLIGLPHGSSGTRKLTVRGTR